MGLTTLTCPSNWRNPMTERTKFSFWDRIKSGEDVKAYSKAVTDGLVKAHLSAGDCKLEVKVQVGYSVAGEPTRWVDAKPNGDGTWSAAND